MSGQEIFKASILQGGMNVPYVRVVVTTTRD